MTKSKTSTIAIVVLSVLLAAALAATIVLAAFSTTKSASTTITFAGGIAIDVTNITAKSGNTGYAWNATYNNADDTDGSVENATADVKLKPISISNTSDTDTPIVLAAKATITGKTFAPESGWAALTVEGDTGWFIYGTSAAPTQVNRNSPVPFAAEQTVSVDGNEGQTITATIDVVAVSAYSTDVNAAILAAIDELAA